MTSSLKKTFDYLKKTENEAAVDVLVAGMGSPLATIREESLRALLERRSPRGHEAIFRQLPRLDTSCQKIIQERPDRLDRAVREALKTTDQKTTGQALKAIIDFRLYDALPALCATVRDEGNPCAALAAKTALELTEAFYAELSGAEKSKRRIDFDRFRSRMTTALEAALGRFSVHRSTQIIEAFLIVAKPKNVVLGRILRQPEESIHATLVKTMFESSRGGVISILLGLLEDPQMPNAAREVIAGRTDRKFVENLARHVGARPTKPLLESLGRFKSLAWAQPGHEAVRALDGECQAYAVTTVFGAGIEKTAKIEFLGDLLLHGKPEGRRAAAGALDCFQDDRVNEFVIRALEDKDPGVLAALIPQLRSRNIPDALSFLIRMVDNPRAGVRRALAGALPEFSYRQFMANFELLPEELLTTTGYLVRRIDLDAKKLVEKELQCLSPVRRRKAVLAASSMGLVRDLEPLVIERLSDEDHIVRVAAAKALADCETMPSWTALRDALLDKSVIVQEIAKESLYQISQSLARVTEEEEEEEKEKEQEKVLP